MDYAITYTRHDAPLFTRPRLPLSKSISNRALILDALTATKATRHRDIAVCDDTNAMVNALADPTMTDINIGAAGTAMRFLTAYFASLPGRTVTLDGTERMRCRPIGQLVDALRRCGADISYAEAEGFPPLTIHGHQLHGGIVEIDASISSQFISALLMIAPTMIEGLTLRLVGTPVSLPYIYMTTTMMKRRGINVATSDTDGVLTISVTPGRYNYDPTSIEPDWSAASYWLEYATIYRQLSGHRSIPLDIEKILGITTANSIQGDSIVTTLFSRVVATDGPISIDFTRCPDLAQTFAVTLALIGRPFTLTGLQTLRIKETDRIKALSTELAKLGCNLQAIGDDTLTYDGTRSDIPTATVTFDTYKDHRMAMSLAFAAMLTDRPIVIRDTNVVNKSYPQFWQELSRAGFTLNPIETPDR